MQGISEKKQKIVFRSDRRKNKFSIVKHCRKQRDSVVKLTPDTFIIWVDMFFMSVCVCLYFYGYNNTRLNVRFPSGKPELVLIDIRYCN